MHLMTTENIHVAMVQETKLTDKSKDFSTPGYTLVREDRKRDKGGGLAFLVKDTIPFHTNNIPNNIKNNQDVELQSISIVGIKDNITINNVYIPPVSSCQNGPNLPLQDILSFTAGNKHTITGGDFNAHHANWFSKGEEDARGRKLADEISDCDLGILNEDLDTRVTSQNQSSPDITLATPSILPYTSWTVKSSLNSDHLPIIIKLKADINTSKSADKVYINFAKADWTGFTSFAEKKFSRLPTPTSSIRGEKAFRKIMNAAAKKFIPKGRIVNVHHNIPSSTVNKINERDRLRVQQPDSERYQLLNKEIRNEINEHRKSQWQEHLEKCEAGSQKYWKTIKGICQPQKTPTNTAIKFNGKIISANGKIVNLLNRQYTPSAPKRPSKQFRQTIRHIKRKKADKVYNYTPQQVKEAIKASKNSKAIGPDGISPIMLKHLGEKGVEYLATLINIAINTSIIPSIWKVGKIIPLLKPGKSIDEGKSYRPISLLSPAAKILEKLILPEVSAAVDLQDHQHGFRKHRSTVSALQEVNHHIASNLNRKKPCHRTILVAIDLSKAFDTVDHELLLKDILHLELSDTLIKFLCSYLRGRQQYTVFRNCKSKYRVVRQGVPQGGVLSPLLFNLYMRSLPAPPGNIKLISYADDCQVLNSGPTIDKTCHEINPYLDQLVKWFKERSLEISPEKSTATIFTTFSNEVSTTLPITIMGKDVPTVKHPKILGVTFDPMLNFGQHSTETKKKVTQRNNVLKCLAGTDWGKSKETIVNTYKAIGRSVLNYGAPVWTPSLSATNWGELQRAQNSALRVATGCIKMTQVSHLHQETNLLPVKEHNDMLTDQYLLSMHRPIHPNHHLLHKPPMPRKMRKTIIDHLPHVEPYLRDGPPVEQNYKKRLKKIHDNAHRDCRNKYPVNKVLNTRPPAINIQEEKTLSRQTRSTLAQLRSGYSTFLQSTISRFDTSKSIRCPDCNIADHTTEHLFNCTFKTTTLSPTDLWTQPKKSAEFLGLL